MSATAINWLAVIGAVVIKQVLAALWYSPVLFIQRWFALTGVTEADMKAGFAKSIAIDLAGSLVMAIVLAHAIAATGATTAMQGAVVGVLGWLGFIIVATLPSVTFERRPFALFIINNSLLLVATTLMGALLGGWR